MSTFLHSSKASHSLSISLLKKNLLKQSSIHTIQRSISLKPNFSKFKKIEQPPGYVVGTVNDAYSPPSADNFEGAYHWTYERLISGALVPLLATPFVFGVTHPLIDASFCVALLFHCQTGFKSCIIDYIPKRVYGFWHGFASKILTLGTFVGIYGVYVLETTSNGLFDLIASLWGA